LALPSAGPRAARRIDVPVPIAQDQAAMIAGHCGTGCCVISHPDRGEQTTTGHWSLRDSGANPTGGDQDAPASRSLTSRTLAGLSWTFSGTAGQSVLQVLVLVALARLLLPEDFGLVGAALVVVAFSEIFYQLGVGPAIVQRPLLEEAHVRAGFALSLGFGVALCGLIWVLAPAIAGFFRMEGLTPILRVLAFVFPLQSVSVVAESLVQRELRFRDLAVVGVLSYLIGYGIFGIAAAALGFGVWALVGARLVQAALRSACLIVLRPHAASLRFPLGALRDLVVFGGGITLTQIFNYLATQGDNLVVGRWLGAEALGLYGRAYQLMVVPANGFGQVVDRVLFPTLARIQDEPERLRTAYRRGIGLTALAVLPAGASACILAPEIVHVLLGARWTGVIVPLQILAAGMFFRTGYKMASTLARSKGAVYEAAWREGVYAILVLLGAWAAHPFGIAGVASAVVLAVTIQFILLAHLGLRLTGMTWSEFIAAHVPGVTLGVVVGGVVLGMAEFTREWGWPALGILLVAVLGALATAYAFFALLPASIVGKDSLWFIRVAAGERHRFTNRPAASKLL
jgi:O-antigen/teichoic acid export membrane protein